ncbi:hypothetical protein CPT_Silence25 [Bacillus phage Silence]|nr:hypothetical protein CPT_Silence25 [Bacillus phage Silence]
MEVEGMQMEESKQILIAITELQANVKNISNEVKEISKMTSTVIQLEQSTKSAHNRLDDIKKDAEKTETRLMERILTLEGHVTWLWRLVIGGFITATLTGIVGLVFYLLKGGGA